MGSVDSVRVGIVGLGSFGRQHLTAFSKQTGVEIVGVADKDANRSRAVAEEYGVAEWFDSGAELIEASAPDAVSIVTPSPGHLDDALFALSHGCSVLLEKPVAMSEAEVDALLAAELESDGFVMPGHISRFARPYATLRAEIADGRVGRVLALHAERHRDRSHENRYPDVHPALMTMVHDIDLAMWLTGFRPLRVVGYQRWADGGVQPHLVFALIETSEGGLWSLKASWLLPDGRGVPDRFEVFGSAGMAMIDLTPSVAVVSSTVTAASDLAPDSLESALEAEVAHFCACVRTGSPSRVVTLAEAADGIRVAEAIIRSAGNGGVPVELA